MGPQVRKLICRKIATMAIPPGGGFEDGLKFLMNKEKLIEYTKEATEWVKQAIKAVKYAPDCEWETDEEIAKHINKEIDKRDKERKNG